MAIITELPRKVAATVSASGALVKGKHNPVDATSGARTMTLPTGATEGVRISVEKIDASANVVSVTGNVRGSAGITLSLVWQNDALDLVADSTGSWWPIASSPTKAALDAAYSPITRVTTSDPTVSSDSSAGYAIGSRWINTTTKVLYSAVDVSVGAAVWQRLIADIQVFTASGTWTKPSWCKVVDVTAIGPGGPGGSGARQLSGAACSGGAGGGGGGISVRQFAAASLGSTESVTVAAGPAGGIAQTTNTTAGIAGTTAANTLFGTNRVIARAGGAGAGGALAAASTAGAAGNGMAIGGAAGGGANGAVGGAGNQGSGGAGGGAGGGISTTPAAFAGGNGAASASGVTTLATGGAVNTIGGAGTSSATNDANPGSSGAGGGSSITAAGGNGGAGGNFGAGGGGGGSSLNGFSSGAGGAGGGGICVVVST